MDNKKENIKIAIFSKFNMAGGSEFRCVELANGIDKFTNHEVSLLSETGFSPKIFNHINSNVNIIENSLLTPKYIYDSDCILVINTDVVEFSTLDYWTGKSPRHSYKLDLDRLKGKKMFFLYNFLVSPSRHLYQLSEAGINVNILVTNNKFFNEITKQDRYDRVRTLPRYVLESPIDQTKLKTFIRHPKDKLCFGMHSKKLSNKWNDEFFRLITDINKRYINNEVEFRFMGIKNDLRKKLKEIDNVTCLEEDEESVKDFLTKIDIFLFFPDWKREEPWARVIAEAMTSGCPIIALDKGGTSDQVLKYNNGFLCKKYKDYYNHIIHFIEHKNKIEIMSKNSIRLSRIFQSKNVIEKLLKIIFFV